MSVLHTHVRRYLYLANRSHHTGTVIQAISNPIMYMAVYSSALLTVAAVSSATYVSQDIDQRECCWVNLMLLPVVA